MYQEKVLVEGKTYLIEADRQGAFKTQVGLVEVTGSTPEEVAERIPPTLAAEGQRLEYQREERRYKEAEKLNKPKVGNTEAWVRVKGSGERRNSYRRGNEPLESRTPAKFVKVTVRGQSERQGRYGMGAVKALITWSSGKKDQIEVRSLLLGTPEQIKHLEALIDAEGAATDAYYEHPAVKGNEYSRLTYTHTEVGKAVSEAEATYDKVHGVWVISVEGLADPVRVEPGEMYRIEERLKRMLVAKTHPFAVVDSERGDYDRRCKQVVATRSATGISSSDSIHATREEAEQVVALYDAYLEAKQAVARAKKALAYDFGWKEEGE